MRAECVLGVFLLWLLQASQSFGPACTPWLSLNLALPFFVFFLKPDFSQMFPVYICLTALPPDLKGAGRELLPSQRFVARFSVSRLEYRSGGLQQLPYLLQKALHSSDRQLSLAIFPPRAFQCLLYTLTFVVVRRKFEFQNVEYSYLVLDVVTLASAMAVSWVTAQLGWIRVMSFVHLRWTAAVLKEAFREKRG